MFRRCRLFSKLLLETATRFLALLLLGKADAGALLLGEGEDRLREEGVGVLKWALSLLRPRCLNLLYSSNSEGVSDTVIISFRLPAVALVGADGPPNRGDYNPVATIMEGVGV